MRTRCLLSFIVLLASIVCAHTAPTRLVDRELARLAADPHMADAERPFRFIVLGDSAPPSQHAWPLRLSITKPFQPAVFKQIIGEANGLRPTFVVDIGDLILGYDLPKLIEAEWDDFLATVAASQRPFLCAPGNHDVFSTFSERSWLTRVGPLHYSFSYGNSHFVVLNSQDSISAGSDEGVISRGQLDWLRKDLAEHRGARNVFVFLHQPFWDAKRYTKSNWSVVHRLLTQYPVRAVFAGHFHRYRKYPSRDGIEYVAAGSAGQEADGNPKTGGGHSYLLVTVEGEEVRWVVTMPRSSSPGDLPADAAPPDPERGPVSAAR